MNPKVSVIVPTKNRVHFLSIAIRSILDQSFKDFEIIIVDAASSEDTRKTVEQFEDARIRYVSEKTDRGISASRNKGIEVSKGEIIAFLDDDDIWMPSKLQKQLNLMRDDPLVGVVYTASFKINESGEILGYPNLPFLKGHILPKILEKNYIGGCSTVVVKRECLEKSGLFDEDFFFGEDFDLWVRLAKHCRFDYVGDPLVAYRVHQKRMTTKTDVHQLLAMNRLFFEKHSKELLGDRRALAAWNYFAGRLHCECGDMKRGRLHLGQAVADNPSSLHYYARLFSAFFGLKVYRQLSDEIFMNMRARFRHFHI